MNRFLEWFMAPKSTTFWGFAVAASLTLALIGFAVGALELVPIGIIGAIIWMGLYLDAGDRERNEHGKDTEGPV